jgi:hypothetical protein
MYMAEGKRPAPFKSQHSLEIPEYQTETLAGAPEKGRGQHPASWNKARAKEMQDCWQQAKVSM